ncbi:MAG: hypothetical protein IT378_22865 [Sandaracinaceae bacterium]|nr:hypothetical protein [Sandaracinaceae bacterium]
MRSLLPALALSWLAATASAQRVDLPELTERPTSGEPSLSSGRTLGTGEVLVAGGVGWPGIWAQATFAPSSDFNLGVRAGLVYGSPVMGFEPGVGGELQVPMRIHLLGTEELDFAVLVSPAFVLSQGTILGETGVFGSDVAWSARGDVAFLMGWRPQSRLTMVLGVGGNFGFVHTPGSGQVNAEGTFTGTIGLEGLISRDTMLFVLADGGAGVAPDRNGLPLFPVRGIFRISIGAAYLL